MPDKWIKQDNLPSSSNKNRGGLFFLCVFWKMCSETMLYPAISNNRTFCYFPFTLLHSQPCIHFPNMVTDTKKKHTAASVGFKDVEKNFSWLFGCWLTTASLWKMQPPQPSATSISACSRPLGNVITAKLLERVPQVSDQKEKPQTLKLLLS